MRNKTKSYKDLPPTPPFFSGLTSLPFLSLLPRVVQGDREWGLWSVHHTLPLPLLPPQGEDSSPSAPAPAWGPSPGDSPPWTVKCEPFTQATVLQEQTAPAWVPQGVTSPASKPPTAWAPLHGATGPGRSLHPHRLFTPLGTSTCSGVESSMGCRWVSAPLWASMGCRGTAWLTMVLATGCRGTSAPAPGAPLPPPSALALVSAEFLLLSPAAKCPYTFFFFS